MIELYDCDYDLVGVDRAVETDPFAIFECIFCKEIMRVRRSNLSKVFPDYDMTPVLEILNNPEGKVK